MAFLGEWVEMSNNCMYTYIYIPIYIHIYLIYVIEYVSYICFGRVETSDVYMCIYMSLTALYPLLKPQFTVMYYMCTETVRCVHPYGIITVDVI